MPDKIKWVKIARNDFKSEPEEDVLLRVAKLSDDKWWYACYDGNFEIDPMAESPTSEKDAKRKCIQVYKKHKIKKQTTHA